MEFSIKMEVVALLMILLLAVFHYEKGGRRLLRYRLFSLCLYLSEVTILLDLASTLTISRAAEVPLWLNIAVTSAYFLAQFLVFSATAVYAFFILFEHAARQNCLRIAVTIICILGAALVCLVLANFWTGWLFRFAGTEYVRGPLNRVGYGVLLIEVCMYVACYLQNRSGVSRSMRRVIRILPPVLCGLGVVQYLIPNLLMNGTLMAMADLCLFIGFQSSRLGRDPLTGLQDRAAFFSELSSCLNARKPLHIVLLYLRHFEVVNRKFGVRQGDTLLYLVSRELEQFAPGYRAFRFGNTQFVLLGSGSGPEAGWALTRRLQSRFAQPWKADSLDYVLDAAIADIVCSGGVWDENQVMDQLEYALQQAESAAPKHLVRFDSRLQKQLDRRTHLLDLIRRALDQESFQIYYQPIYCCRTGRFCWAESLLRLNDDDGTPVSPSEFIPLAEEHGLIDSISWLVLKKVCQFWAAHPAVPLSAISINMSMQQLADHTLSQRIHACLREYGVSPEKLRIEITERLIAEDPGRVRGTMDRLAAEHILFYLDDFGVGYSNFAGVMSLPFETVKLDASLLQDVERDQKVYQTIQLLVQMLHNVSFSVVAEGVEREDQVRCIRKLGVDRIQGYYYARPMPEREFVAFLEAHRPQEAAVP